MSIFFCNKIKEYRKQIINLPGSKSISNRVLILNHLLCNNTQIENLSDAADTDVLQNILREITNPNKDEYFLNVENAGTTMRFLTAALSNQAGVFSLQCSPEMKRRPIADLVEALRTIGADIQYIENEGYPPLKIFGKKLNFSQIKVNSSLSSQYVTALMMLSATQQQNVEIICESRIVSEPYIDLTIGVMSHYGVEVIKSNNTFLVKKERKQVQKTFFVEADWSAAAVWYAFASLIDDFEIRLKNLSANSVQGDSLLTKVYSYLGVESSFEEQDLIIKKSHKPIIKSFEADMSSTPDIVPTLAINLCLLQIPFKLRNIDNLRIKECNRIEAIKQIAKINGYNIIYEDKSLIWNKEKVKQDLHLVLPTFDDHRMVMTASLFSVQKNIKIENPQSVRKSYPQYWEHYKKVFGCSTFLSNL